MTEYDTLDSAMRIATATMPASYIEAGERLVREEKEKQADSECSSLLDCKGILKGKGDGLSSVEAVRAMRDEWGK